MIIYLTISCITLCFCVITYLWVRHKRENKREVALADELIEDENGIIVTRRNYQDYIQTIGRSNHRWEPNRDFFIPLREDKQDFLPKKDIKSHKLAERKYNQIIIRPGAYLDEVDVSIYNDFFRDRRRENE